MKTILVPIDFSDATESVTSAAARLAKACKARLLLIHVVTPSNVAAPFSPDLEALSIFSERMAVQELIRWQQRLAPQEVSVDTFQDFGPLVPTILQHVERVSPEYIVIGSHGHTALHDLIVGSTASGILKGAKCPVVVVPFRKAAPSAPRTSANTPTETVSAGS